MSSIPLVASTIQPQPNAAENIQRLLAIKSMLGQQALQPGQLQLQQQQIEGATQENQLRAQQIKDSQLFMEGMQKSKGSDDVFGDALDYGRQNGMSGQGYLQMSNQLLARQKELGGVQAQDLANASKIYDQAAGVLESYRAALKNDPSSAPAAWSDATQKATALYQQVPPSVRGAAPFQLPQQAPDDKTLDALEAGMLGGKQSIESAYQKARGAQLANSEDVLAASVAKGGEEGAAAQKVLDAMATYKASTAAKTTAAETPAKVQQAQQVETATQPIKVGTAGAEESARLAAQQKSAAGSNAALASVPPKLVAPATEAAQKAGNDYAQAQSVAQRLQQMMDDAKAGNVVSYQLLPEEGALQVTTSQGVHRINMAEIQNYGGGSLWQRMQGHLGRQLTGKSIPDSVLNDMSEMQRVQQQGAQDKYNNTLKSINQNYGANFQPVEMPTNSKTAAQPSAGTPATTGAKTLTQAQIAQAAKDHGVSVLEATRQARAAGYTIQ